MKTHLVRSFSLPVQLRIGALSSGTQKILRTSPSSLSGTAFNVRARVTKRNMTTHMLRRPETLAALGYWTRVRFSIGTQVCAHVRR